MSRDRFQDITLALRYSLGATAFLAGADKFTNLLTHWEKYLAPEVEERLPVRGSTYMKLVGVIEMAVGAGVLAKQKWAPWVASAWLCCIAGNLVMNRDYDIAVRDLNMAVGAFSLARLEGARAARMIESEEVEDDIERIDPDVAPQVA